MAHLLGYTLGCDWKTVTGFDGDGDDRNPIVEACTSANTFHAAAPGMGRSAEISVIAAAREAGWLDRNDQSLWFCPTHAYSIKASKL